MADLTDRLGQIADEYESIIESREVDALRASRYALFCLVTLGGSLVCLVGLVALVVH